MKKVSLDMNPNRICYGLSRIGYTPDSAVCDIADNAVVAGAKNIYIEFQKINENASDRRSNNVKEYLIIDDGKGMTFEEIRNALTLGSNGEGYRNGTLSKFGLGLKSAAFAQGDRLEVVSGIGVGEFRKLVVDLTKITDEYFAIEEQLSKTDKVLIEKYMPQAHGTIIRISKVHQNNHPSIRKTKNILEKRLGVIYYYFLKEGLRIFLDETLIRPYDVLFTEEAEQNGNLDEADWDGKTVKWISKKSTYTVDTESGVTCEIEVTQLPYPPIFELDGEDKASVRDKYNISAGNYGYYVYRNKRLISWAQGLNGIIPQAQDYYSFRGRILIESDADDCFNIDVKKANIALSDEAYQAIEDITEAFKKKSKGAWKHANSLVKRRNGITPNQLANDIAANVEEIDDLPADMNTTKQEEQEKRERKKRLSDEFKRQIHDETKKRIRNRTGKCPDESEITKEAVEETLHGNNRKSYQIFPIESLDDNLLWAPYYDADNKGCVRINQSHRFARLIYEDNSENTDLQILMELLFWQMANAEVYIRTHSLNLDSDTIELVVTEYRRVVSELLANLCRNKEVALPPFAGDNV